MKTILKRLQLASLYLLFTSVASGGEMNYQGRLTDANGNPLSDGQYVITFTLHNTPVGGDPIWGPYITDGGTGDGHTAPSRICEWTIQCGDRSQGY